MKGRNPTRAERQFHDRLVSVVGCIACRKHGNFNDYCSIHHIHGRTRKSAHQTVLPLCGHHHQLAPDSVHGNKSAFENTFGTEEALLAECMEILEGAE